MGQWIDWAGGAVGAASEESEKAWRRRHAADGEARVAEGAHGIGTPGLVNVAISRACPGAVCLFAIPGALSLLPRSFGLM